MVSTNLSVIVIFNISDVDYRCNINGISKKEAANLLQNAEFVEKMGTL